jgi:hypothetical protein
VSRFRCEFEVMGTDACLLVCAPTGGEPEAEEVSIHYSEGFRALIEPATQGSSSREKPVSDAEADKDTAALELLATEGR